MSAPATPTIKEESEIKLKRAKSFVYCLHQLHKQKSEMKKMGGNCFVYSLTPASGQGVSGESAGGSEVRDQPGSQPQAQHDLHHH